MLQRLLLDTSSLMYRADFALPATIRDGEGRPVNAVHGYLDMATRLIESRRPDRITHVFDDAIAPADRVRAYPSYKAHRPPDPEGLPEQFGLLEEVLDAFGAEMARAIGWEADDAIGTICTHGDREEVIEIVTGDRDLLQLVRDDAPVVRVLFTVKGVSELATFDEAGVLAKYGVPPSRYVDFATLRGDPSDGLPGVPGVGEKTARRLVETHATIEDMASAAETLPRQIRTRLLAAADYLRAMREVVPVRTEVEVTMRKREPVAERLADLAANRRLNGPVRRLACALGIELAPAG
jgi:5'-3' exonuclease